MNNNITITQNAKGQTEIKLNGRHIHVSELLEKLNVPHKFTLKG